MKKFILIIISMMILMPSVADAQIKKTGEYKTETIASVRMGFVQLKSDNTCYYLTMKTTNQFDSVMLLKLGEIKQTAIISLNDLLEMTESLKGNKYQSIDNGYGEEFIISEDLGALYISAKGYAGISNIGKSELKRFIKALGVEAKKETLSEEDDWNPNDSDGN